MTRRRMPRSAGVLAILLALSACLAAPARWADAGRDVCPEPNDDFQQACNLGANSDALGFISSSEDIDAYRVVTPDFDTHVHIALMDAPLPYRLVLANWSGEIIGLSETSIAPAAIDMTIPMPGAYYVFVQSVSGESDDGTPYRISYSVANASSSRRVLVSEEFREGGRDIGGSNSQASWGTDHGRLKFAINAGTSDRPSGSWEFFGGELSDYVLTVDLRFENVANGVAVIRFRYRDLYDHRDQYWMYLNPLRRTIDVLRMVDRKTDWLISRRPLLTMQPDKGNRVVLENVGSLMRIWINGDMLVSLDDGMVPDGRLAFGGISWSDPLGIFYDNVLITTPENPRPIAERPLPSPRCPAGTGDACQVEIGRETEAVLGPDGLHMWRLRLTEPVGGLRVRLYDLPANYDLAVRAPDGRLLGWSFRAGTAEEVIQLSGLSAGDYLMFVTAAAPISPSPYHLVVER